MGMHDGGGRVRTATPSGQRRMIRLEECAAISASIDRTPDARQEILSAYGHSVRAFDRSLAHWLYTIDQQLEMGSSGLQQRYDEAYMLRLEVERGHIEVRDYARLEAANKPTAVEATLRELALPHAALPRIKRVWATRLHRSPRLLALVHRALA